MSDPLRTDSSRAFDAASDSDRDAKIEQLLLLGLDHYFSAEYEQAINVWTRALFLDRNHAKARGYIERARSALAERQRESEELVQRGITAFQRGDTDEARTLLQTGLNRGAPSEEAVAVLDRLNRLEAGARPQGPAAGSLRTDHSRTLPSQETRRTRSTFAPMLWFLVAAITIAGIVVVGQRVEWGSLFVLDASPPLTVSVTAPDTALALPRRGETALRRARRFFESGHFHEALAALDLVKPTDPQKVEADALRSRIQRELIAMTGREPASGGARELAAPGARDKGDGPLP
jgi:tetratricopeptide (TPR) repeat protein